MLNNRYTQCRHVAPPHGGAWIEILKNSLAVLIEFSRSPHGERGLKTVGVSGGVIPIAPSRLRFAGASRKTARCETAAG